MAFTFIATGYSENVTVFDFDEVCFKFETTTRRKVHKYDVLNSILNHILVQLRDYSYDIQYYIQADSQFQKFYTTIDEHVEKTKLDTATRNKLEEPTSITSSILRDL